MMKCADADVVRMTQSARSRMYLVGTQVSKSRRPEVRILVGKTHSQEYRKLVVISAVIVREGPERRRYKERGTHLRQYVIARHRQSDAYQAGLHRPKIVINPVCRTHGFLKLMLDALMCWQSFT